MLALGIGINAAIFSIRPIMGRLYTPKEYSALETDTVLISSRFWKEPLGGDPYPDRSVQVPDARRRSTITPAA
jgi:hypothetical protein